MYTNLPTSQSYHFATKLCTITNFDNFFQKIPFVILKRKSSIHIVIENNSKSFDRYLSGTYVKSMFVELVTEIEVKIEIDKLNQIESAGYDELSAKVIKFIGNEICRPLAHIFNLTFTTGIIPQTL